MLKDVFVPNAEIERQLALAEKVRTINGKGKKVFVSTFGCQQNEADSERMLGLASLMGYEKASCLEEAQLIIFNTCAIREHAELKVLSKAGALRKLKEKDKSIITAVCGCMIEQEHRRAQLLKSYPYVDILFGTDKLHTLPEMVLAALTGTKHGVYVRIFRTIASARLQRVYPLCVKATIRRGYLLCTGATTSALTAWCPTCAAEKEAEEAKTFWQR